MVSKGLLKRRFPSCPSSEIVHHPWIPLLSFALTPRTLSPREFLARERALTIARNRIALGRIAGFDSGGLPNYSELLPPMRELEFL